MTAAATTWSSITKNQHTKLLNQPTKSCLTRENLLRFYFRKQRRWSDKESQKEKHTKKVETEMRVSNEQEESKRGKKKTNKNACNWKQTFHFRFTYDALEKRKKKPKKLK